MDKKHKSLSLRENSVFSFVTEARDELKKVTWPTRREVVKLSVIVIIVSLIVGIYVGGLDYLFIRVLGLLIK